MELLSHSSTDMELLPLIKEIIYDGLSVTGLDNITSYLYGDEMVEMQDYDNMAIKAYTGKE